MHNYLLKSLEAYFAEILSIEGKLSVLESFLTAQKDSIIAENRQYKMLVTAITTYRDLTLLETDNNSFTPNYCYDISIDTIDNEIKDIISQQCCHAIAQGYEVFESFFLSILTEFLVRNQKYLHEIKFTEGSNIILVQDTIKKMLKDNQGTNNKDLIRIVRKVSELFRIHDKRKINSVAICQWFDVLSMVRHTLIHNRQVISPRLLKFLLKDRGNEEIFDKFFKRKRIGDNVCIYLERTTALDILNWLNSFAHLIFLCLSNNANLNLSIPQYLPHSKNLSRFSWTTPFYLIKPLP